MVRLGTKWPSITSTCSQSAPVTESAASASRAKSAERMLGAIIGSAPPETTVWGPAAAAVPAGTGRPARGSIAPEQGAEHRIGAVPVWPELDGGAAAQARHAREHRSGVDQPPAGYHGARLCRVRRADDV